MEMTILLTIVRQSFKMILTKRLKNFIGERRRLKMDKIFLVKAYQEVGEDTTRTDFNKMIELSPQEVELLKELVQDDIFDQCCHGLDITERDKKNLLKKLESL